MFGISRPCRCQMFVVVRCYDFIDFLSILECTNLHFQIPTISVFNTTVVFNIALNLHFEYLISLY